MKVCEICLENFEAPHPRHRAKTCSKECWEVRENRRKRVWEAQPENRIPCPACGGPTGHTSDRVELCRRCRNERTARRSEATRSLVSDLWLDGHDRNEIALLMGWTPRAVSARIAKWRRTDPDLFPYRSPARARQAAGMRAVLRGRRIGSGDRFVA
jgi:hypothetical protein